MEQKIRPRLLGSCSNLSARPFFPVNRSMPFKVTVFGMCTGVVHGVWACLIKAEKVTISRLIRSVLENWKRT